MFVFLLFCLPYRFSPPPVAKFVSLRTLSGWGAASEGRSSFLRNLWRSAASCFFDKRSFARLRPFHFPTLCVFWCFLIVTIFISSYFIFPAFPSIIFFIVFIIFYFWLTFLLFPFFTVLFSVRSLVFFFFSILCFILCFFFLFSF